VGQDYADQRYYAVGLGRFTTADPTGLVGVRPNIPGTWNRFAYTTGDPINFMDRKGTSQAYTSCSYTDSEEWDCEIDDAREEPPAGAPHDAMNAKYIKQTKDALFRLNHLGAADGKGNCGQAIAGLLKQEGKTMADLAQGANGEMFWDLNDPADSNQVISGTGGKTAAQWFSENSSQTTAAAVVAGTSNVVLAKLRCSMV